MSVTVVFESTNKADAETVLNRVMSERFGVPGVVALRTAKIVGSASGWGVVIFSPNRPGPDTSCRSCGLSTHVEKDCFR